MPLVWLHIGVSNKHEQQSATEMVSSAPSVFNTAISKVSTLYFFGYSPARGSARDWRKCGWWRIIRTVGSDTPVRFQQLADVDADGIKERLTTMDGESLCHFNIDTFAV